MHDDRTERLAKARERQPRGRPKARLYDINELAAYLHVSRRSIYRLIDRGLPVLRVGFVQRFELPAVMTWIHAFTDRGDALHWTDEYPGMKRRIRRVN